MKISESVAVAVLSSLSCADMAQAMDAEGSVPPFEDLAGPERWFDGPDAAQPGTDRGFPDVATREDGQRIHVWNATGGGITEDIFVRLWNADGSPATNPQVVNTTIASIQRFPRLAVSADGSFVVIFQSWEPIAARGVERIVVRSQAYDANGSPVGVERQLSTLATNTATNVYADVAALRTAGGGSAGYAVVWKSATSAGPDTNGSIQGCLLSSTGVPGAQFQVNSTNGSAQNWSSVTELTDGGFLAVWVDVNDVWGRRFNAAGAPVTSDFQITTFVDAGTEVTDAAIGWDGSVLIVWEDRGDNAGTSTEIRGRLYDADLVAQGDDFRINNVTDDTQFDPRIGDLGPRGFLVVWASDVPSGTDAIASIEARLVTGSDTFEGGQVQLNLWENNTQQTPGAHGWYGRMTSSWDTLTWDGDPPPTSGSDDFIVGRDIEACIFCDDFDWFDAAGAGNLWRWSAVTGAP